MVKRDGIARRTLWRRMGFVVSWCCLPQNIIVSCWPISMARGFGVARKGFGGVSEKINKSCEGTFVGTHQLAFSGGALDEATIK